MSGKINSEIEDCVRNNVTWQNLPIHLKQILKTGKDYNRYVFNYSLKNQLRYRGNLVRHVFRNEQRYYELLVEKSISYLCLFPYHLADIITKGLRVTPFNYYVDVICYLLKNDKSYDTLPNFTAVDCLRVLGIGRNEYLSLISDLKTNSTKFFNKPNPKNFLPKLPIVINIEPWWKVEVGFVLENDIQYINDGERSLIDDLIDFGSHTAGRCNFHIIHSLYKKGLIYLDVPISGDDHICIPPLKNFVMNRVSGDYFENLLYKIFVSADEHMSISELAHMLQINLDAVKQAISLFCRLGFAIKKSTDTTIVNQNSSWDDKATMNTVNRPDVTPLNYHALLVNETNDGLMDSSGSSPSIIHSNTKNDGANKISPTKLFVDTLSNSNEYISSDGNTSDFSIINSMNDSKKNGSESPLESSEMDDLTENRVKSMVDEIPVKNKNGKRVGFLFDSTLTAFLMMGNLSPGLKNHAVTMFEVGKLSDESMDTFLSELEKVSLLDAEGEGEVSRYFTHAIILRSTIIALKNILDAGLDLLRLECLECLDAKTRDRILEKKYKFIISAAPLNSKLSEPFSIPFFGQFYRTSHYTHMWTKLFYNHMSGYGPPSLLITKGTILKTLPRIFLGYGKLLITITYADPYIINSENYRTLNDQLRNGCVLVQGYGILQPGEIRYESFPFDRSDPIRNAWSNHRAVLKLNDILNFKETCGYITFVKTGVPDIGCENYDVDVHLIKPKSKRERPNSIVDPKRPSLDLININTRKNIIPSNIPDLTSPTDGSEITSFNIRESIDSSSNLSKLKSPNEDHFAVTPRNSSPANVFRSDDCNELLAKELAILEENSDTKRHLVSQSSIEISIENNSADEDTICDSPKKEYIGEEWTILDIQFGVPLFDVDCNTRICEHIVRYLSSDENLQEIKRLNTVINKKFLKFVSQCLYFEDDNMELNKFGKLIPSPRINLAFENGKISYWNGK